MPVPCFCKEGPTGTRRVMSFMSDETGAATIEFVLWLPIFMAVLCMIVDATMIFSNRTQALRIIQDANRGFAIGRLTTTDETETYILDRIQPISPSVQVATTVDQGIIVTAVVMPARELDVLGILGVAFDFNVGVSAEHIAEN